MATGVSLPRKRTTAIDQIMLDSSSKRWTMVFSQGLVWLPEFASNFIIFNAFLLCFVEMMT